MYLLSILFQSVAEMQEKRQEINISLPDPFSAMHKLILRINAASIVQSDFPNKLPVGTKADYDEADKI